MRDTPPPITNAEEYHGYRLACDKLTQLVEEREAALIAALSGGDAERRQRSATKEEEIMAHITISDEHYRELLALAQRRGVNPDDLADSLLDALLTAADQRAYWGPDIETQLEASRREREQRPARYLTEEEFFAELATHLKAPDADA